MGTQCVSGIRPSEGRDRVRKLQEGLGQPIWAAVGDGSGGWAVCRDGQIVRSRWGRLSCIDAQVIAAELQRAYEEGREAMRAELHAEIFG